jgi:hypothetical protein
MKTPTLHSMVKHYLAHFPNWTTEDLFESLSPDFPKCNPRWLRNNINSYRARLLKKMKEQK